MKIFHNIRKEQGGSAMWELRSLNTWHSLVVLLRINTHIITF